MAELTRRDVLGWAGRGLAAAVVLQVPDVFREAPWVARARAAGPTVEATFTALVEAVTTDGGEAARATARWMVVEFDRALAPVPEPATSAVVAALLDQRSMVTVGKPFALGTPAERRHVLERMVKDPSADTRQLVNQVLPLTSFAYWTDATLPPPARPGGPRLARWDEIGFPGPSHGYEDTYQAGGPPGFRPMRNFER